MISRIRFYMTFDEEWIESIEQPHEVLKEVLEEGFDSYGEICSAFEYYDGTLLLTLISGRDCEILEEIISEILLKNLPHLNEFSFDIEIDLDVEVRDYNF